MDIPNMSWSDHFPRLRKKIFRKNKIKTLDICDLSSRISPLNRCFLSAFRLNTAGLAPPPAQGGTPLPPAPGGGPPGGVPPGRGPPRGGCPTGGCPQGRGCPPGGGVPPREGWYPSGGVAPWKGRPSEGGAHQRGVPHKGVCPLGVGVPPQSGLPPMGRAPQGGMHHRQKPTRDTIKTPRNTTNPPKH